MPFFFEGKMLSDLELQNKDDNFYFRLHNKIGNSILVEYLPILLDDFNYNDYELFLFDNNYLSAENDVFQIIDKIKKIRLGWIFPLSNLEGKEHDYYTNEFLNRYKFVAYQLLLLAVDKSIEIQEKKEEYTISDLYKNNPIILILSKENTSKIENFSLDSYIPSLSKFGYYKYNGHPSLINISPKKDFCLKFRSQQKLKLVKSQRELNRDRFFSDLFSKHLNTLDHHLIRFHLLYQIIEYILSERFDFVFSSLIETYNASTIKKNDFIERINSLSKERVNIRKVIDCLKEKQVDFDYVNLERDAKHLLSSHNIPIKSSLGDLIYDVRNLIVHNYRSINDDEIETLENITHELELITINIIEYYIPNECEH